MSRDVLTNIAYIIDELSLQELSDIRRLIELKQQYLSYRNDIFIPKEEKKEEYSCDDLL